MCVCHEMCTYCFVIIYKNIHILIDICVSFNKPATTVKGCSYNGFDSDFSIEGGLNGKIMEDHRANITVDFQLPCWSTRVYGSISRNHTCFCGKKKGTLSIN